MKQHWRTLLIVGAALLAFWAVTALAQGEPPAGDSPLPLPSTLPLDAYEVQLYDFLGSRAYADLGWVKDKRVRDTGPYIDGRYYGTHPAVRIYYSPEVYAWLKAGRQGPLPDGAMIIKEMFDPPAAQYAGLSDADIAGKIFGYTVMVRDSRASKDGWFWSYYGPGQAVDGFDYPFDYPNSGFGQYCVRCHASAVDDMTFSSLRNIEGEPGDPISYRVDDSWRARASTPAPTPVAEQQAHPQLAAGPDASALAASKPTRDLNVAFIDFFDMIEPVARQDVLEIPGVNYDHVFAGPDGPGQFLTADQCMSCHDGQGKPFGPNMYIPPDGEDEGEGGGDVNLSPFGEWSWSMMGLAGRDPIFFAQLESELAIHNQGDLPAEIQNTCFRCHGVMGQRELHIDQPDATFDLAMVYATDPADPNHKYGALARNGVSCTVCHQIVDDGRPLHEIVTGQFAVSPPGAAGPGLSYIYGPFDDPATRPMVESLGMKPVASDYIKSSRLCGSCHTVYLPIYDAEGNKVGDDFEQTTYLEWINSAYQNEYGAGSDPKTCQDCHMTGDYHGQDLAFRIANIQDTTYPEADNLAPEDEISVPIRDEFRRHTLLGANIFALEMFNQFDDILGVRKADYMTGSKNGLPTAIAEAQRQAQEATADVAIEQVVYADGQLTVDVKVTNKTGHRFPTGVGFRRAFLAFQVLDAHNDVVWASGRTNAIGVIVDANGQPLPSELQAVLDPAACAADANQCEQAYQPHYQLITAEDQVQIYQELVKSPEGKFTTSFLNLAQPVKDNRLLPLGWTLDGPPGFAADEPEWKDHYLDALTPKGNVLEDKAFLDGSGADTLRYQMDLPAELIDGGSVVATLYYQTIPPSYLLDRFTAADGDATRRLYYLASHLNVEDTAVENWKLPISVATAAIGAAAK